MPSAIPLMGAGGIAFLSRYGLFDTYEEFTNID